jgi:hypothetical protein
MIGSGMPIMRRLVSPWGQRESGGDQRGCDGADEGKDTELENRLHPKLLAKRNLILF